MDRFIDSNMETLKEQEQRWKHDLKANEQKLETDLKGWIENGIPIPNYIKKKYPYFVADYCVKANRADLVRDLLPMYHKQKKSIKRWKAAENAVTGFFNLLNLLLTLFLIFLIAMFIYAAIFGAPDWFINW